MMIKETQIPIISVYRKNDYGREAYAETLRKQGLNVYTIYSKYPSHDYHKAINDDLVNMGMYEYLLGIGPLDEQMFTEGLYGLRKANPNYDPNQPESETNPKWIEATLIKSPKTQRIKFFSLSFGIK